MTKTEIEAALTSGRGTHQGVALAGLSDAAMREMRDLGYVGKDGGLTRKGSLLAGRLRTAALEAAFG
jgi:hypothetical protein